MKIITIFLPLFSISVLMAMENSTIVSPATPVASDAKSSSATPDDSRQNYMNQWIPILMTNGIKDLKKMSLQPDELGQAAKKVLKQIQLQKFTDESKIEDTLEKILAEDDEKKQDTSSAVQNAAPQSVANNSDSEATRSDIIDSSTRKDDLEKLAEKASGQEQPSSNSDDETKLEKILEKIPDDNQGTAKASRSAVQNAAPQPASSNSDSEAAGSIVISESARQFDLPAEKHKIRKAIFPVIKQWLVRATPHTIETCRLNAENSHKLMQILDGHNDDLSADDFQKIGQIINPSDNETDKKYQETSKKYTDAYKLINVRNLSISQIRAQLQPFSEEQAENDKQSLQIVQSIAQQNANQAISPASPEIESMPRRIPLWRLLISLVIPGKNGVALNVPNTATQEIKARAHLRSTITQLITLQKRVTVITTVKTLINSLMAWPVAYYALRPFVQHANVHHPRLVTNIAAAASAYILSYSINKLCTWWSWNPQLLNARRQLANSALLSEQSVNSLATELRDKKYAAERSELDTILKLKT